MKTVALLLCLVAPPAFADAPPLGEAAKKEQERREKLKKAGPATKTLTEEDLAAARGRLASTPGGLIGREKAAGSTGASSDRSPEETPEAGSGRGEQYWRQRAGSARARVAYAQRRLERLQMMIRYGQPEGHDKNGRALIYSVYDMKAMADAAAAEVVEAQAGLEAVLEEGRRAGALPGWLR